METVPLPPMRQEIGLHHGQLCVSKPDGGHLEPVKDMPSVHTFKRKVSLDGFPKDICLSSTFVL